MNKSKEIDEVLCICGSNKYTIDHDISTVPGQIVEIIFCDGCGSLKGMPQIKFY